MKARVIEKDGKKEFQILAGANSSGLQIGTLIDVADDSYIPNGYLKCDGSTFDATEYPALYMYFGETNVLPNLYDTNSLPEKPDFRGSYRSSYYGDMPYYANLKATLQAAGIDHDSDGFAEDGVIEFVNPYWAMLWIENTDGSYWCVDQIPYTDGDYGVVHLPVKKGQKIYCYQRTNQTSGTVPTAGEYYNSGLGYINIWYYQKHKLIKATAGLDKPEHNVLYSSVTNYVDSYTPVYSYDSATEILTITQRGQS